MKNKNNIIIGILIASIAFNLYLLLENRNYESFYSNYQKSVNATANRNMHMMSDGTMMNNNGMMQGGMMRGAGDTMGSMMMNMTYNMEGKSGAALEKVFLSEMIVHHEGAVDMAKMLLQDKTIKPELAEFANKIIAAQSPEIEQMKVWLKAY